MELVSFENIRSKKKSWTDERINGIYFLFDTDNLVYIGYSSDCEGRVLTHRKDKKFDAYSIIELNLSKLEMLKLEDRYIQKYKPALNKTIKMVATKKELTEHEKIIAKNIGSLIQKQKVVLDDYEADDLEYWTSDELNQLRNQDGSRSDEYFYYKRIMQERIKAGHFNDRAAPDVC